MDKADDLHPLGFAIAANSFGRLEQVLDLRELGLQQTIVRTIVDATMDNPRTSGSESSTKVSSISTGQS